MEKINQCKICSKETEKHFFKAKEMLLGTRDSFLYCQCSGCNGVYLLDELKDLGKYYPDSYHDASYIKLPYWKKILFREVYKFNFFKKGILGKLIVKLFYFFHGYNLEPAIGWVGKGYGILKEHTLYKNRTISDINLIDIGCGQGGLLQQLEIIGFKKISGVEPFSTGQKSSLNIKNISIENFLNQENKEKYDIIILSHVFEHLGEQENMLINLKNNLNDEGIIILAMPVIGKMFSYYKENWFSLDAPRHFMLHSEKSFLDLTKKTGWNIQYKIYEHAYWEFVASELYSWDISFDEIKKMGLFSFNRKYFKKLASILDNCSNGGSSVTYFLTKK